MYRKHQLECLNLGWISYQNLWPLKVELEESMVGKINFHEGCPVEINKLLKEGKITCAPCSSVCLLESNKRNIFSPLGVCSEGEVGSVFWGVQGNAIQFLLSLKERTDVVKRIFVESLEKHGRDSQCVAEAISREVKKLTPLDHSVIPRFIFSKESATSILLSKVLMQILFGISIDEQQVESSSTAELVIGDEALRRRGEFVEIVDLGSLWNDVSTLPFVFAVWQGDIRQSQLWSDYLVQCAHRAQNNMRYNCHKYLMTSTFSSSLENYWKKIYYLIGDKEMLGLDIFLSLCKIILSKNQR